MFPERRFGDFVGRHAHLVHVLVVQQAEVQQRLGDLLFDLLIVVVVAQNDLHARMLALFGRPETESRSVVESVGTEKATDSSGVYPHGS